MFGIFYLLANAIGLTIGGAKAAKDNYDARQKAIEKQKQGKNRPGIYTDYRGVTRSLATGKQVSVDFLTYAEAEGRDCYVRDMYGNPIRNLSEEMRQERLEKALANRDPRRSVTFYQKGADYAYVGRNGSSYARGDQYIDLETRKIYVVRMFEFPKTLTQEFWRKGEFYMDIKTGLLVRETDAQKENRRQGKYPFSEEMAQKFIDYFNEIQDREGYYLQSKYPEKSGWGDEEESELAKRWRMARYYCNDFVSYDIPL